MRAYFYNDFFNFVENYDLSFSVNFINAYAPPLFTEELPMFLEMDAGDFLEFPLPQIVDSSDGKVSITIIAKKLSAIISVIEEKDVINFTPSKLMKSEEEEILIELYSDVSDLTSSYKLDLIVNELPQSEFDLIHE